MKQKLYISGMILGATKKSIVIIGALFKIIHFEIGPLTGNVMLTIGLVTEAIIFALSAFEPVDDDLDWALVYPELAGGKMSGKKEKSKDAEGLLSKKLDEMLKEAQIDAGLMGSLSESIRSFEDVAKVMSPTEEALNSTKKYSEEMATAASQMESLNNLYQVQVQNASKQSELNTAVVENTERLKEQMESLANNLSSLNGVYGGMLSAMSKN